MYNVFEQRPANVDSILARLDHSYAYKLDRVGHDIMRSIATEMNLPWQDHGNSIELGNLGHRRDYGASIERLDGARCQVKTQGKTLEAQYELAFFTPEGDLDHSTGVRTIDSAGWWGQVVTEIVNWIEDFDIDAEKERITREIISAIDTAPDAESAFKATSFNGEVYADMARDIYLSHYGIETTQRKPREQREIFLATWENERLETELDI